MPGEEVARHEHRQRLSEGLRVSAKSLERAWGAPWSYCSELPFIRAGCCDSCHEDFDAGCDDPLETTFLGRRFMLCCRKAAAVDDWLREIGCAASS